MGIVISGERADIVWDRALQAVMSGDLVDGRNGSNKEASQVLMVLQNPQEKWVYNRRPHLSIAFALAEVFWILNGSNDASIINTFNPILHRFAADGDSPAYYGAYGYRLRNFGSNPKTLGGRSAFLYDQIERAYVTLKENPQSRHVVLNIYNAEYDLPSGLDTRSNDIPCNICSMLKVRKGKLEWTQIMRSNDIMLGWPHNVVQFSTIQEILAGWLNIGVGQYSHLSDSLHLYSKYFDKQLCHNKAMPTNQDSFAIDKHDSDVLIRRIFDNMVQMAQRKKTKSLDQVALLDLSVIDTPYDAYRNAMIVMGAYVANACNYVDLRDDLIKQCSNQLYQVMFCEWCLRASWPCSVKD